MSTASRTRQRRNHVTPSLVKSETFLFAVLVIGLAIYVPYMFKTAGKGSSIRYANTTVPIGGVVPDAPIAVPSPVVVPPTPAVVPPPANVPVTQPLSTPTEQRPAPITYILPYLLFFGRSVLGLIKHLPFFVYRILHAAVLRPLYYPFAFILAVLRPITLLLEIIYAVFLRTPLAILSWFIREAIYPLFVSYYDILGRIYESQYFLTSAFIQQVHIFRNSRYHWDDVRIFRLSYSSHDGIHHRTHPHSDLAIAIRPATPPRLPYFGIFEWRNIQ